MFSGRFPSVVNDLAPDRPVCSPGHVRPDLGQTLGQVSVLIHLGKPAEPEQEKQDVMSADRNPTAEVSLQFNGKQKIPTQKETTGNTWDRSAELLLDLVHRHSSGAENLCCLTLMKIKMLMKVLLCGREGKQS